MFSCWSVTRQAISIICSLSTSKPVIYKLEETHKKKNIRDIHSDTSLFMLKNVMSLMTIGGVWCDISQKYNKLNHSPF